MSDFKNHICYWAGNLKILRSRLGVNQEQLSEQLNISRSKLNAHENGQTINPTIEDLFRFSSFYNMSIDTLLRTDLSKLSDRQLIELQSASEEFISGKKLKVLATTVTPDNRDNIEFVPRKARAGYLSGFSDPEFISQLPIFHLPHLPLDRKFRMFATVGDSMFPIPENSLVIGNYIEDWQNIKIDTPCIVITKEDGIVFKLVTNQIAANRSLLLRSLNPQYAPYEVNVGDVLEVWQFVNYISDTIPAGELSLMEMSQSLIDIKATLDKLIKEKQAL